MLQEIQKAQSETQIIGNNLGKRNAYNYYRSKVNLFKRGHSCIDQLPTCKPVFRRSSQVNPFGEYTPYIGCTNDSSTVVTKHHRGVIQGHIGIDLHFLEDLFNKGILPATEDCGVFAPLSSRQKQCDRDHPQGPGRLKHTTCEVVFNGLVPVDISQCPYILFTSHGVHKHPPPPSTKPRHMSQETSRKRRRSSSSSVSESHSTLPQPPSSQRSSRSSSRSTSQNDNESIRSSQYPRRVASPNALTSEQRREELELRKLEAYRKQREAELKQLEIDNEKQEEENRLMRLENEKLWLKLMEEGIPFSRSRTSRN
ncbi:hypothetical protein NYO67_4873 [Aspergillus flavus]|nr:hypothetical protein NYO67_4873 [Aspergillus flavus]